MVQNKFEHLKKKDRAFPPHRKQRLKKMKYDMPININHLKKIMLENGYAPYYINNFIESLRKQNKQEIIAIIIKTLIVGY